MFKCLHQVLVDEVEGILNPKFYYLLILVWQDPGKSIEFYNRNTASKLLPI